MSTLEEKIRDRMDRALSEQDGRTLAKISFALAEVAEASERMVAPCMGFMPRMVSRGLRKRSLLRALTRLRELVDV